MNAPKAEKNGQDYFNELRIWVVETLLDKEPIRRASYQMALSAYIHRIIKFGPDETLNHLNARDLLNLTIFTNGELAEWLMRAAFNRALVEDDRVVYERLAQGPLIIESVQWYWKLVQGILGQAPDPKELSDWLNGLPMEEKSIARLMIARVYPDTVHLSWLDEVPKECPAIAFQLAGIAARKKDCLEYVERWVNERPLVRNQAFN